MNRLSIDKRERVLAALIEGNSIRSSERMVDVHRDTVMKLLVDAGGACLDYMHENLRELECKRIQVDELWSFVQKKQRHLTPQDDEGRTGDFWTFIALDSDTKLIPAHRVGKRDRATTRAFMADLAERIPGNVQISSDAMRQYVKAVHLYFGDRADYGRAVKQYVAEPIGPGRYSPPSVKSVSKEVVQGNPRREDISTSHVERLNLSLRMNVRRFTRLTNAFSKKVENLRAAVALEVFAHNFLRIHGRLRMTPAMASGIDYRLWSLRDVVDLADEGCR